MNTKVAALHLESNPSSALKGRGTAAQPCRSALRPKAATISMMAGNIEDEAPPPQTTLMRDATRSIITRNDSPDIGFDRSINPYRGCEHGCIYCFARPTHAYLGLSPGLDFETKIVFKPEAAIAAGKGTEQARLQTLIP